MDDFNYNMDFVDVRHRFANVMQIWWIEDGEQ